MIKILQQQYIEKRVILMFIYIGTLSRQHHRREGNWNTENFSWKSISHLPNPRLLEKELTQIRTVFRNTNGYPNWIINQVFEQIKVKQRDAMPNSNLSNENEATQTSNQTIVENHDDKKHLLMIPYQEEKGEQVIKWVRKTVKRLLPSNIKVQICFTGNKLSSCFNS